MIKKRLKKIPKFKSEDEEAKFWSDHDLTDYFDANKAEEVIFPNLKLSSQSISMRVPQYLLADIKVLANKMDVPYQSMIKMWLAEKVQKEITTARMTA